MRLTLTPTSKVVEIETEHGDTVPGRVWEGTTEAGVEVACVITRVATERQNDLREFEATLDPQPPARSAHQAFPLRMLL